MQVEWGPGPRFQCELTVNFSIKVDLSWSAKLSAVTKGRPRSLANTCNNLACPAHPQSKRVTVTSIYSFLHTPAHIFRMSETSRLRIADTAGEWTSPPSLPQTILEAMVPTLQFWLFVTIYDICWIVFSRVCVCSSHGQIHNYLIQELYCTSWIL